jgi:hypothetical protein
MTIASRLSWLALGKRARSGEQSPGAGTLFLHGRGDFLVTVSGVAQCQAGLHDIYAGRAARATRHDCIATLLPDRGDPRARSAIALAIAGQGVGYLPRHISTQYDEWLQRWRPVGLPARCRGVIIRLSACDDAGPRYDLRLDLEIPFRMTTE